MNKILKNTCLNGIINMTEIKHIIETYSFRNLKTKSTEAIYKMKWYFLLLVTTSSDLKYQFN